MPVQSTLASIDDDAPLSTIASGAGTSSSAGSANASSESPDELAYVLSLYTGLGSLPRTGFVRKFASILQATEGLGAASADDTALLLHITQIEELLQAYLKESEYTVVPTQSAAGSAAAVAATDASSAPAPAPAPGVLTPARAPSLLSHSPEFTAYFLDTAIPGIVRNLLQRSYYTPISHVGSHRMRALSGVREPPPVAQATESLVPRINAFFQIVLRVIAKHMHEPTHPVTVLVPAPTPPSAAAVPAAGSSSVAAPPAASETAAATAAPALVPLLVKPLFTDSVSNGLLSTLLRLFDKERTFYSFYDRPLAAAGGAGGAKGAETVVADDELDLSDDEEIDEVAECKRDESAARKLGAAAIMEKYNQTPEQFVQARRQARHEKQAQRERERAAKIEARIDQQRQREARTQYCAVAPGSPGHGLLQSNIQCFGECGGFAVMLERLSVGINTRIDSRVPVAARRGRNPAQGARVAWYTNERNRRVRWHRQQREDAARAEGRELPAAGIDDDLDEPEPIRGSFPSIAPYLTPASFVTPPPGGLARIPLYRSRLLMDPLLKAVNGSLLSKRFFESMCTQVKDLMIIRLLHLGSDESRQCDKDFLTNVLQEYVWRFIKHLSVLLRGGSWADVAWPMLDRQSLVDIEAYERAEESAKAAAVASGTQPRLPGPPPMLHEQNLNADELMECITIYLSYQLFTSSLLEKRINGLSDLTRYVQLSLVRDKNDRMAALGHVVPKQPVTAWLNMYVLSDYLLEIKIMDDLFGVYPPPSAAAGGGELTAIHPQLIARSEDIVRYLARLGKLTDSHVKQMWHASINKHETVENAIYTLLAASSKTLSFKHVRLLLQECVATVPYAQWNTRTIKLLADLAKAQDRDLAAVPDAQKDAQQEEISRLAAATLWSVLTLPHEPQRQKKEDAELPAGSTLSAPAAPTAEALLASPANNPSNATVRVSFFLRQQCALQLQTLLAKPAQEPLRQEYIHAILGCVHARITTAKQPVPSSDPSTHSIGMLLWLLPGLLNAYTNAHAQPEEVKRWKIVSGLFSEMKIMTTLLAELAAYTGAARANLPAVMAAVAKRVGPRRRAPDAALLVLTGSALEPVGDAACLGIALSDLDASVALPASFESSAELLDALRNDGTGAAPGASTAAATVSSGSSNSTATMTRSSSAAAAHSVSYSEQMSHELEVLVRLELVRYLLGAAFETLRVRDIDSLWSSLAGPNALSPRSSVIWSTWLRMLHVPKPTLPVSWIENAARAHQALFVAGKVIYQFQDNSKYNKMLDEEAAKRVFLTHLCANPVTTTAVSQADEKVSASVPAVDASEQWTRMDESAFICWRHYFLVLNEGARLLALHAPLSTAAYNHYCSASGDAVPTPLIPARSGLAPPVRFGVVPGQKPLIGLEHLWSICLHAQQPNVVSLATDLLIRVHACLDTPAGAATGASVAASPSSSSSVGDVEWKYQTRERFLERCMEFIKVSSTGEGAGSAANAARILRCLSLLQSFMRVCETAEAEESAPDALRGGGDGTPASSGSSGAPFVLLVRLGPFGGEGEIVKVEVVDGQTVRQLKEQLASLLSTRASKLGLALLTSQPVRELLNYETVSFARLASADGMATVALRAPGNLSNVNHPGNNTRMPGEDAGAAEDDEEDEDDAALQLARNFTPATPGPGAATGAFPHTPSTAATSAAAHSAASRQPTQLLANSQQHFDTLFSLLQPTSGNGGNAATSAEISQRVWKLLISLPTNRRLLEEMQALNGISESQTAGSGDIDTATSPWSRLLDPQSPFKLLYSLRIISQLADPRIPGLLTGHASNMVPSAADTKAFLAGVQWRSKFLRLGGVNYLYAVLRQMLEQRAVHAAAAGAPATRAPAGTTSSAAAPASEWDECRHASLALLLRLFTFFLLVAQADDNPHILYLLPGVIRELPQAPDALAAPNANADQQLQIMMRSLHMDAAAFMRAVHFPSLTQACLRLMSDCAKAAAKAFRSASNSSASTNVTAVATAAPAPQPKTAGAPPNPPLARSRSASAAPASTAAAVDDATGGADDALLRPAMMLLSACVLHRGPPSAEDPAAPTPLSVLLNAPNMPTLFSTLFFLVAPSISQEQGEAWLSLAVYSKRRAEDDRMRAAVAARRREVAEAAGSPRSADQPSAAPLAHPLALHKFLFVDILLKVLQPVVSNTKYASGAQDFFTLLVLLSRHLLAHEKRQLTDGKPEQQIMGSFDWTALMQRAVAWLKARPVLEAKHSGTVAAPTATRNSSSSSSTIRSVDCDQVLIGLLNLVTSLVRQLPELKVLVAARPKHSQEAEELMLSDPKARSGGGGGRGGSPTTMPPDLNPAAGLVDQVFKFLFDLPSLRAGSSSAAGSPPPPKCKRRATRLAAYDLLLELSAGHRANFVRLACLLLEQNLSHNSVSLSNEHQYAPEDHDKSSTGYVGLQNLAATCYLNSMMQQLFFLPEFRRKLLAIDTSATVMAAANQARSGSPSSQMINSGSGANTTANGSQLSPAAPDAPAGPPGSESLLYQLQLLFGSLQECEKKSYNPISFCRAFKGHDGNGIDVRVQQDVDEYFNALCDKLETALKENRAELQKQHGGGGGVDAAAQEPAAADLVKETFGGELEHQLVCLDCPHRSSRTEAFCALPLAVANKASLQASLEQFITGEMLEGDNMYMCHTCKRKVRTLKRAVIRTLPDVLVLNLKRFDFDYDKMAKTKINDRLAFPMDGLDMEPFTAEGVAKREVEKSKKKGAASGNNATDASATVEENKDAESKTDAEPSASSSALPAAAPQLSSGPSAVSTSGASAAPLTTYTLVGILLHSGGSESGHYTSLIKDRVQPSSANSPTARWLEFNDSVVREFDPSQIPAEAFGGTNTITTWDARQRKHVKREVDKTRSAYLLIYARDGTSAAAVNTAAEKATASSATPLHSPLKRAASITGADGHRKQPSFGLSVGTEPDALSLGSAAQGTMSPPQRFSTRTRSPAPLDDGGITSPPIMPSVRRANSGPGLGGRGGSISGSSKKLDFNDGGADDESDPPLTSPAFSRFGSYEAKVPEFTISSGGSSSPASPTHGRSSGSGGSSSTQAVGACSMPPQILERIWDDNLTFLRNKQLFQPDYFRFLVAFLQSSPQPLAESDEDDDTVLVDATTENSSPRSPRKPVHQQYGMPMDLDCAEQVVHVQLAVTFLTDVLAHAKYATSPTAYAKEAAARRAQGDEEDHLSAAAGASGLARIKAMGGRLGVEQRTRLQVDSAPAPHSLVHQFKQQVYMLLATHTPAAVWFLSEYMLSSRYRLRYFLFDCGSELMRDTLAELCVTVLGLLVPHERSIYDQMDIIEVKGGVGGNGGGSNASASPGGPISPVAVTPASSATVGSASAGPQSFQQPRSLVLRFVDSVLSMLRDLSWHWRSLSCYWGILRSFADFGHNERMYLIHSHNMIGTIIDFYLGDYSPWAKAEKYKRPVLGDADTPPNFYNAMALLDSLIRSSMLGGGAHDDVLEKGLPGTLLSVQHGTVPLPVLPAWDEALTADIGEGLPDASTSSAAGEPIVTEPADDDSGTRTPPSRRSLPPEQQPQPRRSWVILARPSDADLTAEFLWNHAHELRAPAETEMVFHQEFLSKLLREACNPEANRLIVQHLVWNNPTVDAHMCKMFLRLIDEANFDRLAPLLDLLPTLLATPDSLQDSRIHRYLNERTGLIHKCDYWRNHYPVFSYLCLKYLILDLASPERGEHPARMYLIESKDSLFWAVRWIQQYHANQLPSAGMYFKPSPELEQRSSAQQATLQAIAEWFGVEYLTEMHERQKEAALQRKLEQEAIRRANQERAAARAAANPAAAPSTGVDPLVAASGAAGSSMSAHSPARGPMNDSSRHRARDFTIGGTVVPPGYNCDPGDIGDEEDEEEDEYAAGGRGGVDPSTPDARDEDDNTSFNFGDTDDDDDTEIPDDFDDNDELTNLRVSGRGMAMGSDGRGGVAPVGLAPVLTHGLPSLPRDVWNQPQPIGSGMPLLEASDSAYLSDDDAIEAVRQFEAKEKADRERA